MTQDQLATVTGIKRVDINAYCKGRKRLGQKNGPRIARTLGLAPDFFNQPDVPPSPEIERLQQRAEELLQDVAELRRHLGEMAS